MKDLTNMAKEMVMEPKFTAAEETARKRYITLLKNFHGMSAAVEKAIADIKAKKLFRPYKSLKEFLMEQCGWKSKRRAQQVIKFIEVKAALPPKSEPLVRTERAARALASVPEDQRVEVLEEAGKDGKITAKSIKEAAAKTAQSADGTAEIAVTDDAGKVVPEAARPIWDRREEAKAHLNTLRGAKREITALSEFDPMWCEVNLQGVIADIVSAISRFSSAVPEYVCPYCKGIKLEGCKACLGRGVMSKFMYTHAVPEEMKK